MIFILEREIFFARQNSTNKFYFIASCIIKPFNYCSFQYVPKKSMKSSASYTFEKLQIFKIFTHTIREGRNFGPTMAPMALTALDGPPTALNGPWGSFYPRKFLIAGPTAPGEVSTRPYCIFKEAKSTWVKSG